MVVVKPTRLKTGDTLGIISPAGPVAFFCPKRFARGVKNLEARGFKVLEGEHASARHTHTAGTIEQRLEDIHAMVANEEI